MNGNAPIALPALGIPPGLIRMDEDPPGLLALSFKLEDAFGRVLAQMNRNVFEAVPSRLYDLRVDTAGTKIKIQIRRNDTVLDIHSYRLTEGQLIEMVDKDWSDWREFARRREAIDPAFRHSLPYSQPKDPNILPFEMANDPRVFLNSPTGPMRPSEISEGVYEIYKGRVYNDIMKYARFKCLDDEGKIAILDYRKIITHHLGKQVTAGQGIDIGGQGIGFGAIWLDS
jgi:hypothetical protein